MLEIGAAGGDGEAAFVLAEWRLAGTAIRRDLGEARRFYGRAAELGIAEADAIYTALLANGAGGNPRDWESALNRVRQQARHDPLVRAERDLIEAMDLDPDGNPAVLPQTHLLNSTPAIRTVKGLLTPAECRFLARVAEADLQKAIVIDPRTGQARRHPIRTAESAGYPFVRERPVLHAINRRIAAVTGTSYEQGEPTQILSYRPGQEYRLHSDAIANEANQRIATVLVCLKDDFEGGETVFPRLGLAWRGATGDALHFLNVDRTLQPEPLAWHAGTPVTSGHKIMLSKWVRARPLDLSGPPGRPL
ncbi:prolyl hydroxylase family protein [Tsuneonella dongtanensis]|nr:2OG-Fe(II) oxygenase [Tsuneonella dongtanensis]